MCVFFTGVGKPEVWFTENATNYGAVFGDPAAGERYTKDAFHRHLVGGEAGAINPDQSGTKACIHYTVTCKPGESKVVRLRLCVTHQTCTQCVVCGVWCVVCMYTVPECSAE